MLATRLLLLVLMCVAWAAEARDVPVRYTVDAKELGREAVAGTSLSFELFAEPSCATPVHQQLVLVEDVAIMQRLNLVRARGANTPQETTELNHVLTGVPDTEALYLRVVGKGVVPLGVSCQVQASGVQGPAGPPGAPVTCGPNQAESGPTCVDRYEASIWKIDPQHATVIAKVRDGTVTLQDLQAVASQRGAGIDDYGSECPDSGNGCVDLYAVSIAGVVPATSVTWFQASATCRNSGQRLLTNAEWQAAALGTPDPGLAGDGVSTCNANTFATASTGSAPTCISDVGVSDMVGNVWEWVADWHPRATACPGWGGFADDIMCLGGASTTLGPGTTVRGGAANDGTIAGVFALTAYDDADDHFGNRGFRCGHSK